MTENLNVISDKKSEKYLAALLEENVSKNLVNHVKTFNNKIKSLKFYHSLRAA